MNRRFEDHEAPFVELDEVRSETSIEVFDRLAFARETVAKLMPYARVAVCNGTRQVQAVSGRLWGAKGSAGANRRWVLVAVPPTASRRAIVQAIAALGGGDAPAYFWDVHLGGA